MPDYRPSPSRPDPPPESEAPPSESAGPAEHSLSHLEVPAETTPTWELEMLISGAVLFGLVQVPPVVSDALARYAPRLGSTGFLVAFEAYLFVKAILYALIAGFVLHLCARAYWVALVGLDSVFPQGIRWDRTTVGPITRDYQRTHFATLPARIERIDNFASVIFATAFAIAFILLGGVCLIGVIAGLTWLVSRALLHGREFMPLFFGILGVLIAVQLVGFGLDRRVGQRLARDGRAARFVRFAAGLNYVQGVAIYGPITQTLSTNVRRRIAWSAMSVLFLGSMAAGMLDLLMARNVVHLGAYRSLPTSGPGVVDNRYYGDQRTGQALYAAVPWIQSDLVRDPYVRLFVPYFPARDEDALVRGCGAAGSAGAPGRLPAAGALLACLGRLRVVSLDGRAVDADYRFYTDPQSGLEGLLGYVPVDGLAHGRHVLVIQPLLAPGAGRADSLRFRPDSIPFRL